MCRSFYELLFFLFVFFFFKQKTAYEMRISDWSSDVCSSDLLMLEVIGRCLLGQSLDRRESRCRARGKFSGPAFGRFVQLGFGHIAIGDPDRNRLLGRKEACVDQQRGRAARTHRAREEIADAGVRTKAEPRISVREAGRAIGRATWRE